MDMTPIAFIGNTTEADLISYIHLAYQWRTKGIFKPRAISNMVLGKILNNEHGRRVLHSVRSMINSQVMSVTDFKFWIIYQNALGKYPAYASLPWKPEPYTQVSREFTESVVMDDVKIFMEYYQQLMARPNPPANLSKYKTPIGFYAPYTSDGFSLMWEITRGVPIIGGHISETAPLVGLGFYLRGAIDVQNSEVAGRVNVIELEFRRNLYLAFRGRLFLAKLYDELGGNAFFTKKHETKKNIKKTENKENLCQDSHSEEV